jgi:hypothetical protein
MKDTATKEGNPPKGRNAKNIEHQVSQISPKTATEITGGLKTSVGPGWISLGISHQNGK